MKDFFPGDSYATDPATKRNLSEYLLLGSRWSLYSHFIATVLHDRRESLAGRYDDEAWAKSSFDLLRKMEVCGGRFSIEGLGKVRAAQGPVVYVANHMSTLETTVLPGLIRPMKPVTYVVKDKLMKGFFWGPIMRSRDPIPVTRKDPRKDLETVLERGLERLSRGISVIIFPQGTRTEVWRREGFNSLGVKLASRAGVSVQPIALKTDFWGSSGLFKGFGPVNRSLPIHIEFGEAYPVSGRGKAEHEACLDFIESRLKTWGARMARDA